MDYFRLFYEYFEEKVSDFLFVKSGSVIIFFLYNLVANFAREYESSHDSSYKCFGQGAIYISALVLVDSRTFKYCFNTRSYYRKESAASGLRNQKQPRSQAQEKAWERGWIKSTPKGLKAACTIC